MVRLVRVLGLIALGLPAFAVPSHADASPTRRIVVFSPEVPRAQRLALARSAGAGIVRELPLIHAVAIEAPSAQVSAAESRLLQMPEVRRVDADPRINWLKAPDARGVDFALPDVKALLSPLAARRRAGSKPPPPAAQVPWGIARVGAPKAWARTKGAGVNVCVIDTGIDRTHPNLAANVKGGWNAITKGDDFTDDNGHGSHVSGTIAAVGDATGVVGVAPKASLYGVKVLDAGGSGTFDDVIAGMQWAVDHHMPIVSMSLGADEGNQSLADMVKAMRDAGVILIAAAGNSGGAVGFPAGYPGAIAVAASDSGDRLADFSSRGPEVAVIAPGVDVKSTYMEGGYRTLSGTSMATPHVSGLAALYVATHRGATPAQARAALARAAAKLPGVPPEGQGAGLPSAVQLVK